MADFTQAQLVKIDERILHDIQQGLAGNIKTTITTMIEEQDASVTMRINQVQSLAETVKNRADSIADKYNEHLSTM